MTRHTFFFQDLANVFFRPENHPNPADFDSRFASTYHEQHNSRFEAHQENGAGQKAYFTFSEQKKNTTDRCFNISDDNTSLRQESHDVTLQWAQKKLWQAQADLSSFVDRQMGQGMGIDEGAEKSQVQLHRADAQDEHMEWSQKMTASTPIAGMDNGKPLDSDLATFRRRLSTVNCQSGEEAADTNADEDDGHLHGFSFHLITWNVDARSALGYERMRLILACIWQYLEPSKGRFASGDPAVVMFQEVTEEHLLAINDARWIHDHFVLTSNAISSERPIYGSIILVDRRLECLDVFEKQWNAGHQLRHGVWIEFRKSDSATNARKTTSVLLCNANFEDDETKPLIGSAAHSQMGEAATYIKSHIKFQRARAAVIAGGFNIWPSQERAWRCHRPIHETLGFTDAYLHFRNSRRNSSRSFEKQPVSANSRPSAFLRDETWGPNSPVDVRSRHETLSGIRYQHGASSPFCMYPCRLDRIWCSCEDKDHGLGQVSVEPVEMHTLGAGLCVSLVPSLRECLRNTQEGHDGWVSDHFGIGAVLEVGSAKGRGCGVGSEDGIGQICS